MIHELIKAYKKGVPSDEQECIHIFDDKASWRENGFEELTGSDEETNRQIQFLINLAKEADAPDYICEMLNDWRVEGF